MNHEPISFPYEGHKITVKATQDGGKWCIRVFKNEHPVNYFEYSVSFENQGDALTQCHDLVEGLMQHVRKEIVQNP